MKRSLVSLLEHRLKGGIVKMGPALLPVPLPVLLLLKRQL